MHSIRPDILLEHPGLVIVNKPSGMLTIPDRAQEETYTLRHWLEKRYGKIWVVHRLDKDTSGVIVFARNEEMHKYLSGLFETRQVEKIYLGIVYGEPMPPAGTISEPIAPHSANNGTMVVNKRGKAAQTDYAVEKSYGRYSLVKFDLHTGRTHQIRVHARFMGHPIVCDPLYGDGKPVLLSAIKRNYKLGKHEESEHPILSRLGLHSFRLSFALPDGEKIIAEAPLYKDMRALLAQLEKSAT
jgi:23S rRNA pseudouridine955/2504/2580 synthase/23S rRNA pseudouridine1911/1915/1917 synthase